MDGYIGLPNNIEELKEKLFEICQVSTKKDFAEYMGISTSTVSRYFSSETDYKPKKGISVETAERIVDIFVKHIKIDENIVRDKIYNLLYSPEYIQDRFKEFENLKNKIVHETGDDTVEEKLQPEITEDAFSENVSVQNDTEKRDVILNRIRKVLEEIARDCSFCIEGYKDSIQSEIGGILYVSHEYNSVFMEPHIDMLYGIYLTEANYIKTIHDVAVGTSIEITEPTLKPSATPKWKVNKAEVSFPYAIAVSEGEGDLEIIFNHD